MQLRKKIEYEVAKVTDVKVTDELFKEAAIEADHDIKFHFLMLGKRTSLEYVVYIMVTIILILIEISNKAFGLHDK